MYSKLETHVASDIRTAIKLVTEFGKDNEPLETYFQIVVDENGNESSYSLKINPSCLLFISDSVLNHKRSIGLLQEQ